MSATPDFIEVRGLAVPFMRTRHIDGRGVETFDPAAFDAQIAKGGTLPVQWDSHDTGPGTMRLANAARIFASETGLWFSAVVDLRANAGGLHRWGLLRAMTQRRDPCDQVSVGGLHIEEERTETVNGMRVRRVTKASIDHLAVVRNAAYGPATAAWPMHADLAQAPWRVQLLAEEWETAKATADLQAKRRRLLAEAETMIRVSDRADRDLSDAECRAVKAKLAGVEAIDRELGR